MLPRHSPNTVPEIWPLSNEHGNGISPWGSSEQHFTQTTGEAWAGGLEELAKAADRERTTGYRDTGVPGTGLQTGALGTESVAILMNAIAGADTATTPASRAVGHHPGGPPFASSAPSLEMQSPSLVGMENHRREDNNSNNDNDNDDARLMAIAADLTRTEDHMRMQRHAEEGVESMFGVGTGLGVMSLSDGDTRHAAAALHPLPVPYMALEMGESMRMEWRRAELEMEAMIRDGLYGSHTARDFFRGDDYRFYRDMMLLTGWKERNNEVPGSTTDVPPADRERVPAPLFDVGIMDDLFREGEVIDRIIDEQTVPIKEEQLALPVDLGPPCSKAYCRRFLRAPLSSDPEVGERECRAGAARCVSKRMASIRPASIRGATKDRNEGFVGREFLRPDVYARWWSTGELPREVNYCLMCLRFQATRSFFRMLHTGVRPTIAFHDHYNAVSSDPHGQDDDEYTLHDMLPVTESKTGALTGIIKPIVMWRASRYFPSKMQETYTHRASGTMLKMEVDCFEERSADFA